MNVAEPEYTAEQISAYFLELECALDRIERAVTHYQILDIERSASAEQIKISYQHCMTLLSPTYNIRTTIPDQMFAKIQQAFLKVSQSYTVLSNFGKKTEYDNSLLGRSTKPLPVNIVEPPKVSDLHAVASEPAASPVEDAISIKHLPARPVVYSAFSNTAKGDNRRRCQRFKLSLPVRVMGFDRKSGKWHEMTETIDVSRTGVTLNLRRRVRNNTILYLTLPLPTKLRGHGFADQGYNVYSLVRRVEPPKRGVRNVGLEFLGEHPPPGYLEKPWSTFRTKSWAGTDRRRKPRLNRLEKVEIEYLTETMQYIAREEARTENISCSGVRICVKTAPADFDLIRIVSAKHNFESLAVLRNRYLGKDGVERVCVQFIDREWPA